MESMKSLKMLYTKNCQLKGNSKVSVIHLVIEIPNRTEKELITEMDEADTAPHAYMLCYA